MNESYVKLRFRHEVPIRRDQSFCAPLLAESKAAILRSSGTKQRHQA